MEFLAIELLGGLLRWRPSSRITAPEVLSHSYWGVDISAVVFPAGREAPADGKSCVSSAELSEASTGVPPTGGESCASSAGPEAPPLGVSGVSADLLGTHTQNGMDLANTPLAKTAKTCCCSLNCGNTVCERMKKAKSRAGTSESTLGCPGTLMRGFTLCMACKCEKEDCARRKLAGEIFCPQHTLEQGNMKKGEYMNKWSVWKLKQAWPWELQMVAIHGWMLARMCPCDLDAFLAGASAIAGTGNRLTGVVLVHFWALAFLKWPKCVKQWASAVTCVGPGQPGVSAGSPDAQAAYYAAKSVELASHCDMDDMQWMHEQISVGTQRVLFGPVIWLCKLGMNPAAESNSKRRKVAAEVLSESPGKKHAPYRVVPNATVWKTLMEHASEFDTKFPNGLALPESRADLLVCMNAVDGFLKGFPPSFGYSDKVRRQQKTQPDANADGDAAYCRKHILRKIILWVHSNTDASIWEQLTIGQLRQVCADKKCFLQYLDGDMTWKQATHSFTVSPLMISCWTCLFGQVRTEEHRAAFKSASARLWQIVLQLTEKHESVEPNLRTLAVEVALRSKNKK